MDLFILFYLTVMESPQGQGLNAISPRLEAVFRVQQAPKTVSVR